MSDILTIIIEWPLIIQGALGSGLFWLVLLLGQKITFLSSRIISQRSEKNEIHYLKTLRDKYIGLKAHQDKNIPFANYVITGSIYKSLRSLYKGLIWLALGLCFGSVIPVLGVVGFMGCIYHMFKGLSVVQAIDTSASPSEKIAEINERISELEPNKSSNTDGENAAGS
ncbi:hypothetical protein ACJJIF_04015 [Microbulbifer sp. SSSA002]|uniref:hypothetical protein n=1 Tax=Microbulbifer sp. SSSA002 TaxID=3243376 RepID=UPI00403A1D98